MKKPSTRRALISAFLAANLLPKIGLGGVMAQAAQGTADKALADQVASVKKKILDLALKYSGQGDPDFSKQNAFQPLIAELLSLQPQLPVRSRINVLAGAWKQIWGPYNYRSSDRTVDPELAGNEIYQIVSPAGYYYNVTPLIDKKGVGFERIGLLKGEYRFDPDQSDVLKVRFIKYPGLSKRPAAPTQLFELPELVESGKLEPDISIVPSFIVKIFFGGGALKEIYTDSTLRLLYGSNNDQFKTPSLYVMSRVSAV
jgi:hypothetical protein